jgi:hypothetical protein
VEKNRRDELMTNLVLHIGFGKTGSSSIQHHLTEHGSDVIAKTNHIYCVADANGNVVHGDKLRAIARTTGVNYAASSTTIPSSDSQIRRFAASIARYNARGMTPVLSQEAWGQDGHLFKEPLRQLGLDVKVIAYVRPQVEFLNAGWWQWWSHMNEFDSPQDLVNNWTIDFLGWIDYLERWQSIDEVKQLDIRCHGADSVNDFLSIMGSPPVNAERINTSLGPLALKLYHRFPNFRGVHGAHIDAKYGPMLANGKNAPWVVPMSLCSQIIEYTRAGNERLSQMMPETHRDAMLKNPRWWRADAYAREKLMTPDELEMSLRDAMTIIYRIAGSKFRGAFRTRSTDPSG